MQPESQWKKYLIIFSGIILFILLVFGLEKLASQDDAPTATAATSITESDMKIIGPENASASLVEYADFQCPACAAYHPLVKKLHEDFPNDLKIAYRYYPLTSIHKNAMLSAQVAEAARLQGKFNEMHDQLFEHQEDWSGSENPLDIFREYAKNINLNMEQFESDINSDAVKNAIESDHDLGNQAHIPGTPTFFLNGKKTGPIQSYDDFKKIVEDAITQK